MQLIDILGPSLPESVESAELTQWLVTEGQAVAVNDILALIESDKVTFEVSAPQEGIITKLLVAEGSRITSAQLLAKLKETEVSPSLDQPSPDQPRTGQPGTSQPGADQSRTNQPSTGQLGTEQGAAGVTKEEIYNQIQSLAKKSNLGPKARRLIMEHGEQSPEVERYLEQKLPPRMIANEIKLLKLTDEIAPTKTRVPMTSIRRHIAKRLLDSKNSTAMLTTFNEVDLGRIVELRKTYGEAFQKKHGIRLGFMSFFVKAVAEAMKSYPIISACIEGDDIIYSNTTDISIAVSTERGLVTPVLRSTELKSLADIEREIAAFAQKANQNKLTIDDMTGGNFTITNGGVFGSLFSTPIINPPQSAILGMHGIKKRPVVVNDQIVIRPMMYIALSYDHRLIDGKDSVRFLAKVKDLLEDPTAILLDL